MRALVVINPRAGRGRAGKLTQLSALAKDVLGRRGYETEVVTTDAPGAGHTHALRARERGVDLVVAWGGDGTVNEVASAITFSEVSLGIVPAGSGNGLARDLALPSDPARALDVAASGRVKVIDVLEMDGLPFFNVAGIGLDAVVAARLALPGHRRGLAGYLQATFNVWPRYLPRHYRIRAEGLSFEGPALFIALANSRQYGQGAQIAPGALLDDGKMDLVVVDVLPIWQVAARIPALFRGTLADGDGLTVRQVSSVIIESDSEMPFHVDGEPRQAGSVIALGTRPLGLRVRTA